MLEKLMKNLLMENGLSNLVDYICMCSCVVVYNNNSCNYDHVNNCKYQNHCHCNKK